MGGAWAYEALSFGGFWAWDPVENASLVPWLTLVGSGHLMIINKRKEATSLFATILLVMLTFPAGALQHLPDPKRSCSAIPVCTASQAKACYRGC
jgi:cytochrome c biogenesis factor